MNVLIVIAHPEPCSFSSALKEVAVTVLDRLGHEVVVTDLYGEAFEATGDARDFTHRASSPFHYQEEQRRAFRDKSFAADLSRQQSRLLACDLLMLNFPLWWYGPPAILKGWIDRVLAAGFAYDRHKKYETGGLAGRRGMLSVTTGSPAERYVPPFATMDQLFLPLQKGLFEYVGMTPLDPFVAYSAARVDDGRRQAYLAEYRAHIERQVGPA